jgi:hypothetical protein
LIKNVFKDPEFRKDFSPNDPIDRATADYCIGNEVGSRAAKEFARHVKKVRDDEHVSFLSKIAMSMLGQPSDDRRRGEVIGFFSELEEILHKAMRCKHESA